MLKATRQSSVRLSPVKIRSYLADRGIYSLREFELAYSLANGRNIEGTENTSPAAAWRGQPLANNRAKAIAQFLGFDTELPLLIDRNSPWEMFVYKADYQQQPFMSFRTKLVGQLNLIVFDGCDGMKHDGLDKHKLSSRFYLELKGQKGDHFFIVMRSQHKFSVLAPVVHDNHKNLCLGTTLIYPQNGRTFAFDPREGGGFRELIAIRVSGVLPFNARSEKTGYAVSLGELNLLTTQLHLDRSLTDKIAVNS